MRDQDRSLLGVRVGLCCALLALLCLDASRGASPFAPRAARAAERRSDRAFPLRFVANDGRFDPRVRFFAQGLRHAAFFTPDAVVLSLVEDPGASPVTLREALAAQSHPRRGLALSLSLVGASPDTRVEGALPQRGRANYFTGRDPTRWRRDVPTWGEVRYRDAWPGVDVAFRQSNGRLKWAFTVAPGARVDAIRLAYRGVESVSLEGDGDLRIETARGSLEEPRPVSWQERDGVRVEVPSRFVLSQSADGETLVSFAVGDRDESRPLVIDPALIYATFLGGTGQDVGLAATIGAGGNIYVTGLTGSLGFPTKLGAFETHNGGGEGFVARVDPFADGDDSLVYSTFLGGDLADQGTGIAVDEGCNAYFTGYTFSHDFPLTDGSGGTGAALDTEHEGAVDAFVVKLNAAGDALLYSTFLGGSYDELAQGLALRTVGLTHEVYVTGLTDSPDFPAAGDPPFNGGVPDVGLVDAFVARLTIAANQSATLDWATFVGGSNDDSGASVAVDSDGHAYVVGDTRSNNFPVTPGNAFDTSYNTNQDAFLAKLDADGSCCLYATYLGGANSDKAHGVALDVNGDAYFTGVAGAGFPTSAGAFDTSHNGGEDVFVARFDPDAIGAASRVYVTYLGGAGLDRGRAITVAPDTGLAFVAGETASATFPVTAGANDAVIGLQDAFLATIHPSGDEVLYATFLGANSNEAAFGVAIDPNNHDDVALTGGGQTGFPVTTSAYQPTYGGGTDAFVASYNLAPQLCLGSLARELEALVRLGPPTCLTCPPVLLRVAVLILSAQVNLARVQAERANARVASLTLDRFRRDVAALSSRGVLPSRPAADLGLKAAECTRVLFARSPKP